MLRTLRSAFALLTRWPVAPSADLGAGAAAFPLVGAVIGTAAALPVLLIGSVESVLAALAAVAIGTIATGGLHLDGLADTADALAAPDPDRAEQARTDPSTGPSGVVALVLAIGIEVAAVASLADRDPRIAAAAVVVAATVGRTLPVLVGLVARRHIGGADAVRANVSSATGFGAWFMAGLRPADGAIVIGIASGVIVAATALVGDARLALGAVLGVLAGSAASAVIMARRRGVDGDGLGATVAIGGIACLTATALIA